MCFRCAIVPAHQLFVGDSSEFRDFFVCNVWLCFQSTDFCHEKHLTYNVHVKALSILGTDYHKIVGNTSK